MKLLWSLTCFLIFIAKPIHVWSQSIDEVLIVVNNENPEIAAARSTLSQTYDEIPTAWTNFLPNISFSTTFERSLTDDNYNNTSSRSETFSNTLSIGQDLFNLQHNEQFRRAKLNIEKQKQTFRSVQQIVLMKTITAYLAVIKNRDNVNLQTKNVEVLKSHLENTKIQHEMRRRTNADLAQAKSRLAKGNADKLSSKVDYNAALSTYQRLVGVGPDDLFLPNFENDFPQDIQEIERMAASEHPDVLVASIGVKAAKSDIRSKERAFGPSLALSGSIAKSNTNNKASASSGSTISSLGLTFTVPIYQKGVEHAELATARKALKQSDLELLTARRLAVDNARKSFENKKGAIAKIQAFEAQVQAATVALNSIRQELDAGRRTVLNLLDAEQELLNARVSLATAKHNLILTTYRLQERVGRLHTLVAQ
jgi:outer membrane protein